MKTATIISIGDELTSGRVCNTNAAFIGRFLSEFGIINQKVTVIPDQEEPIRQSLRDAYDYDYVLVTGGLGPTHDDITKNVTVDFFNTQLMEDPGLKSKLEKYFNNRKIKMSDKNYEQAQFPEKAEIIPNEIGTAAGMHFQQENTDFFFMPGVPAEMKKMLSKYIAPLLGQKKSPNTYFKKVRTFDIGESDLYAHLQEWINSKNDLKVAFLPQMPGVDIFLESKKQNKVDDAVAYLTKNYNQFIYGYNDDAPSQILGVKLKEKELSIATAESCTGGLIGDSITNQPGSSDYFTGGIVAYSNAVKINLLEVKESTIKNYGAVSRPTAMEMAEGIRNKFKTDIGVSTTGIAGPTGGTKEKPVGTVWIGIAGSNGTRAQRYIFNKNRITNKQAFARCALINLIRYTERGNL